MHDTPGKKDTYTKIQNVHLLTNLEEAIPVTSCSSNVHTIHITSPLCAYLRSTHVCRCEAGGVWGVERVLPQKEALANPYPE